MWNNVVNAWWPLLFYKATDAPRFRAGMITMICTCVATLAVTGGVWYFERRERRRRGRGRDEIETRASENAEEKAPRLSGEEEHER